MNESLIKSTGQLRTKYKSLIIQPNAPKDKNLLVKNYYSCFLQIFWVSLFLVFHGRTRIYPNQCLVWKRHKKIWQVMQLIVKIF